MRLWVQIPFRFHAIICGASDFHRQCNGIANTVTLIKTTNGNLFGGYTALPWDSSNTYKVYKNALIYSLVNKKKQPFIAKSNRNPTGSIYCSVSNVPVFGNSNGYDLKIVSDSNSNTNDLNEINNTYNEIIDQVEGDDDIYIKNT